MLKIQIRMPWGEGSQGKNTRKIVGEILDRSGGSRPFLGGSGVGFSPNQTRYRDSNTYIKMVKSTFKQSGY